MNHKKFKPILGRVMYFAYEQYWLAVLANPTGNLP